MSAIYSLIEGVNPVLAADVNQLKDAINASMGITDTNPTDGMLPKLTLPSSAGIPAPSVGMVYLDTATKIPFLYESTGVWKRLGPIRQMIRKNLTADLNILNAGIVEVLSQAIVTTGGNVLVLITMPWVATCSGGNDLSLLYGPLLLRSGFTLFGSINLSTSTNQPTVIGGDAKNVMSCAWLDASLPAGSYTYNFYCNVDPTYSATGVAKGHASGLATSLTLIELN